MAPTEIVALARIIDELDYYQLLHLRRDAGSGDVKRAFHASSRSFHPDANRHLVGDVREASRVVAKRITEAYAVLRNPRRRQAYDRHLQAGDPVRIQLAEAEAEAGRHATEERTGRTAQGRQYYKLAEADLTRRNWAAAARNLQMALTFEPDNDLFKQRLAQARHELR